MAQLTERQEFLRPLPLETIVCESSGRRIRTGPVARNRGFPIPRDEGGYVPESRRLSTAEAFGSMLERAENSTSSLFFGMKISDGLNQFVRRIYREGL